MSYDQSDWTWFETDSTTPVPTENDEITTLAKITARVFRGDDGEHLLRFMNSITTERTLGPDASDNLLRHLEGQRQFVAKLNSLVRLGRSETL